MSDDKTQKQMPDFDRLTDRIILETPDGPFVHLKTNLDPENPETFNPYKQGHISRKE